MAQLSFTLTGNDTVTISKGNTQRTLKNFAQGAVAQLTFANNVVNVDIAKDGGILANDISGNKASISLRILAGTSDDNFFLNELASFKQNPAGYVVLNATFIKNFGDGAGVISKRTYTVNGGAVTKNPDLTYDVNGDVNQAVNVYNLDFTDSTMATN
jgi:hypothetical protein